MAYKIPLLKNVKGAFIYLIFRTEKYFWPHFNLSIWTIPIQGRYMQGCNKVIHDTLTVLIPRSLWSICVVPVSFEKDRTTLVWILVLSPINRARKKLIWQDFSFCHFFKAGAERSCRLDFLWGNKKLVQLQNSDSNEGSSADLDKK